MITILQNNVRHIINKILSPDLWTLDQATGIDNTSRYPRVAFESAVLKHDIRSIDSSHVKTSAAFQYQINFRFNGKLRYDQLPIKELTNILSYLSFIFNIHPSLLVASPSYLNTLDIWQYQKVDPCLYSHEAMYGIDMQNLNVNSFIPVMEMEGNDWLLILVMSFDVMFECKKSDYRQFFSENLTDQINDNPAYVGGLIGEIKEVRLGAYHQSTERLAGERVIGY